MLAGSSHGYQVRARDTSGNRSALSESVSATTPADAPPSVPTNVTATSSSYAVTLGWDASTDDVGVAGYDVYRDGSLLASLGDVAYTDVAVLSGSTLGYQVLARDAYGHSSAPSDLVSVTVPAPLGLVWADGFESGLSGWTSSNLPLVVESTDVHTGSFAAEGSVTNGAGMWARRSLGATYQDAYARVWFEVKDVQTQIALLGFRGGGGLVSPVSLTAQGNIVVGGVVTPVPKGVWHALELHLVVNGAASVMEVWLDGIFLGGPTVNLVVAGLDQLQVGDSLTTGRTYDVIFDDVAFGTSRLGQ